MNNDTVINEIQKAIEEIRHNGEHHAEFVQSNGELVIAGLEMALDILNSVEPKPCDDTISRQAAIEAIFKLYEYLRMIDPTEATDGVRQGVFLAGLKIEQLPSAQPERKTRKWKKAYFDHEAFGERPKILYCSVCNQCIAYPTNFCPNCGADMRGEQND